MARAGDPCEWGPGRLAHASARLRFEHWKPLRPFTYSQLPTPAAVKGNGGCLELGNFQAGVKPRRLDNRVRPCASRETGNSYRRFPNRPCGDRNGAVYDAL
jgi:hypothetical protein